VIRLVDRFPSVILLGSAVLAWTAYSMIVREPLLQPWLTAHPPARFVIAVLVFSISLAPWWTARLSPRMRPLVVLLPSLMVWLLAFEIAAPHWPRLADLFATDTGRYLVDGLRWLGWLPIAAGLLWLREQRPRRAARG
jgi:hypothetical protein